MSELDLVERIRKMAGRSPGIALGIGDDCAIYRPKAGEELLFTTDQFIEGVHFRPALPAAAVGERARVEVGVHHHTPNLAHLHADIAGVV